MYGWTGKILRVNLTNREVREEPLKEEIAHKYVGGRGFTIRYLYDELEAGIVPPEMLRLPAPAAAVTVPPQVLMILGVTALTKFTG